jgi:cytochrome c-type biogenesis protein
MGNLVQTFSNGGQLVWYLMLLASFLGGLLASILPCSLAMLPLIVGYVGGCSKESPLVTFIQMCSFVLGTAIVFTIIGIACALTGSVFASVLGGYFTLIIASILMIIGLKLLSILDIDPPTIIKAMPQNKSRSVFVYPVLLGMTFALAGTPCSTPILAGIMAFAAIGKNVALSVLMLFLFAFGQGVILILTGLFASSLKQMRLMSGFTEWLLKISGVLLILVACYLYWKTFYPLF